MIISIDAEYHLKTTQYPFLIKILSKRTIKGNFPNLMKSSYKKFIVNIIENHESLNAFPQRLETKQRRLLSPLLLSLKF